MSTPDATGMANDGLTMPFHVANTKYSVLQGTPDPRQGNNPTCFDSESVLWIFFQPVSAGHRRC